MRKYRETAAPFIRPGSRLPVPSVGGEPANAPAADVLPPGFGIFKDDPFWEQMAENIAANRREEDAAEANAAECEKQEAQTADNTDAAR